MAKSSGGPPRSKSTDSSRDPADIGRVAAVGIIAVLVGAAFWRWFVPGVLTYSDWPYLTTHYLQQYFPIPSSWTTYYSGLGQFAQVSILSAPLNLLEGLLAELGVGYAWIERLLFFIPIMTIAPFGTYRLLHYLFVKRLIAVVGALFYTINTYTVMEFASSGHVPSGVAYALMPVIIWLAIRTWEQDRWSDRILAALAIVIQTQYDMRFTYLTAGIFLSYVVFRLLYVRRPSVSGQLKRLAVTLVTIIGIVFALELYWILPALFSPAGVPAAPDVNLNPGWIKALSFMSFDHALAFFHPFWGVLNLSEPQPVPWYFLAWPVLAFTAGLTVWYLPKPKHSAATGDWRVVWLLFVALAAAFLVMGTKAPLAGVYEWLFLHLFGFNAFRDPSKHFMALAIAYAGLIGVTVYVASRRLTRLVSPAARSWVKFIPLGLFGVILVVTMHRLYFLNLQRIFTVAKTPPIGYTALADVSRREQQQFYRILWVPTAQRFGRYYAEHASIDANQLGQKEYKAFLTDRERTESWLENPNAGYLLSAMSVKYVVVPDDPYDEIFRYYDTSRDAMIAHLDGLPFLKRLPNFGSLAVYENQHVASHIYSAGTVDYFADREASVNFPELDRLTGQSQAVDRPALMFWADYALSPKPKYGWQLPDMGQSEQRNGELKVPFVVPTVESYQLWAHRNNQDLSIDSVTVAAGDQTVFRQDDPGRVALYNRRGRLLYEPADADAETLLQSEFVNLGTATLPPGAYQLQVADTTLQDNHDPANASFEQPVQDGLATSSDHTDGRRSLQLSGRRELERTALAVTNFDQKATYRVTFDYKNVSGEAPWYSLDRVGVKDLPPTSLPINNHTWQRFSAVVKTDSDTTGFQLGLLSAGRPGAFTINRFDNVKITEVDGVDTVFLRTVGTGTPEVTFDRHSATRFTAHIRGAQRPFYLVFAEGYHPGWHLTIHGRTPSDPNRMHVMMNGYANAWYLNQTGDYDADIEFTPQQWTSLGLGISAGVLLIMLGWLRWLRKRQR